MSMRGSTARAAPPCGRADSCVASQTFADGRPGRLEMAESSGMLRVERHRRAGHGPARGRVSGRRTSPTRLHELVDEYAKRVVKADKRASKEAANRAGLAHLAAVHRHAAAARRFDAAGRPPATTRRRRNWIARATERIADAEFQVARNVNMKFVLAELVAGMADDFGVGAPSAACVVSGSPIGRARDRAKVAPASTAGQRLDGDPARRSGPRVDERCEIRQGYLAGALRAGPRGCGAARGRQTPRYRASLRIRRDPRQAMLGRVTARFEHTLKGGGSGLVRRETRTAR